MATDDGCMYFLSMTNFDKKYEKKVRAIILSSYDSVYSIITCVHDIVKSSISRTMKLQNSWVTCIFGVDR